MLALPARVPIVDYSRPRPEHFFGPQIIHLPPPPVRIAGLLSATCSAPVIAAVATERVIAHAHVGWNLMPFETFAHARLAVEKVADHLVRLINGEEDSVQWAAAISDLHKAGQIVARGSNPQRAQRRRNTPPSGTSSVLYNNPVDLAKQHQKTIEEGHRLAKRLDDLMNLKVDLTDGRCLVGEYRFVLHPRRDGSDGVVVGRRQWGDYYQDHPRVVFTKEQMAAVLVELDALGKPGAAVADGVRRGKVIVDRGPVTEIVLTKRTGGAEAQIADANAFRHAAARTKLTEITSKPQPSRSHVGQRH